MGRFVISVFLIILALPVGYFIYIKADRYIKQLPVPGADNLRIAIISSINNPFPQADTLILETTWMFCGNSEPEELPITFDTKLEEINHKSSLSRQLNLSILTMTEFHKVMDTVRKYRFNGEYPPSLWDTCRMGKVSADIKAERLSPKKVRLYENYLYNDIAKYVRKDFTYNSGKWTYQVIDTSTQYLSRK